jgi:hypothetical protein
MTDKISRMLKMTELLYCVDKILKMADKILKMI